MLYFFDTEFMEDGKTIELISMGVVSEDGRELYLESAEAALEKANPFVVEHVLPHLGPVEGRVSRAAMRAAILEFVAEGRIAGEEAQFVGYYADYDWVVLCQLFGRMIDLPPGWTMYALDLRQLAFHVGQYIRQPDGSRHHALDDARWVAQTWMNMRIDDGVIARNQTLGC